MASVRITNDIRYHVRNKIHSLFDARIAKKFGELQHLDIGVQVFLKQVNTVELEKAKLLNSDIKWVPEIEKLLVTLEYVNAQGVAEKEKFYVPFKPPVPAPQAFHGYNQPARNVTQDMACYAPALAVLLARDALSTERDTLWEAINKVLGQCTTLRQVLEVWPTALDYMPDDVKKKHSEKVEKREATVIEAVDDSAKMLLMKARMISGS